MKFKTKAIIGAIIIVLILIMRPRKAISEIKEMVHGEFSKLKEFVESKRKAVLGDSERRSETTPSKDKKYKREEICRDILQSHYGKEFPSVRPNFLKNPKTGRNLELDGYNAGLNLAFEHQGKQHYEYPNNFHKTKKEFRKQQSRDRYKKKRCSELGIRLIEIPYSVKQKDIKPYILSRI